MDFCIALKTIPNNYKKNYVYKENNLSNKEP